MPDYNGHLCSYGINFVRYFCLPNVNFIVLRSKQTSSSLTNTISSNYSRSKFVQEIKKRFEYKENFKKKLNLTRNDKVLSQIESIAAQRSLLYDNERFSIIKGRLCGHHEQKKLEETRTKNGNQIPLPLYAKQNSNLFLPGLNVELKSVNKQTESDQFDRGFFVSDDKFFDNYSAATTADLPEDDMTESPVKYYGNITDADENIEFQLPGQKSITKKRISVSSTEKNDCDDWKSNYGTTEIAEENLPQITNNGGKCASCGAHFHCHNPSLPGFVPLELLKEIETNFKKPPFHQKTGYTCRRCFLLKEYNFLLNLNVCEVDYVSMMSHLKLVQEALILLIVDMADLECSIHHDLPKIIGANKPMIVIGNKIDLLPPDTQSGYLRHYHQCLRRAVAEAGISENFNILKYLLVSAKTGFGIEELITNIYQNWIGPKGVLRNDIYVIGSTNAGKSTLFNTFIQSDLCKVRAMDLVERVTTSIWPGTTLSLLKFPLMNQTPQKLELRRRRLLSQQAWRKREELIRRSLYRKTKDPSYIVLQGLVGSTFKEREEELQPVSTSQLIRQFNGEFNLSDVENLEGDKHNKMNLNDRAFQKGYWCYDTPGTVNKQQVLDLFTLEELINIIPRSIIIPRIFILFPGQSLLLGAVARVDIHSSASQTKENIPIFLSVFASKNLKVNVMKGTLVDEFLRKHSGDSVLGAPIGDSERMKQFPKLEAVEFEIESDSTTGECGLADVVLSSLGWALVSTDASSVKISAWTPAGRGLFLRQPPILPHAARYRAQRVVGTAEYKIRPLSDTETFSGTQRSVRPKKIVKKNIKVDSSKDEADQFVNFDLA